MSAVLLIEDDDRIRLSLAMALEDEGYTAHAVATAEEGLTAQRRQALGLGPERTALLQPQALLPLLQPQPCTDLHRRQLRCGHRRLHAERLDGTGLHIDLQPGMWLREAWQ